MFTDHNGTNNITMVSAPWFDFWMKSRFNFNESRHPWQVCSCLPTRMEASRGQGCVHLMQSYMLSTQPGQKQSLHILAHWVLSQPSSQWHNYAWGCDVCTTLLHFPPNQGSQEWMTFLRLQSQKTTRSQDSQKTWNPIPRAPDPGHFPLWPLHKIQPANCQTIQHARITYRKWAQPLNSLVTLTPAWIWLPNCARKGHVQNNEVIPGQKNTCLVLNKPHKQRDTWCPLISNKDTSLQKTHSSPNAYGDCRIRLALSGTHWRWPVCSVPQQHPPAASGVTGHSANLSVGIRSLGRGHQPPGSHIDN